jgi:hypothetical protein
MSFFSWIAGLVFARNGKLSDLQKWSKFVTKSEQKIGSWQTGGLLKPVEPGSQIARLNNVDAGKHLF